MQSTCFKTLNPQVISKQAPASDDGVLSPIEENRLVEKLTMLDFEQIDHARNSMEG